MTTRKDCKHYRLDCAHRGDVEETDITYTYPGDGPRRAKGLIEWLAEDEKPLEEVNVRLDQGRVVLDSDAMYFPSDPVVLTEAQQALVEDVRDKTSLVPNPEREMFIQGLGWGYHHQ